VEPISNHVMKDGMVLDFTFNRVDIVAVSYAVHPKFLFLRLRIYMSCKFPFLLLSHI